MLVFRKTLLKILNFFPLLIHRGLNFIQFFSIVIGTQAQYSMKIIFLCLLPVSPFDGEHQGGQFWIIYSQLLGSYELSTWHHSMTLGLSNICKDKVIRHFVKNKKLSNSFPPFHTTVGAKWLFKLVMHNPVVIGRTVP